MSFIYLFFYVNVLDVNISTIKKFNGSIIVTASLLILNRNSKVFRESLAAPSNFLIKIPSLIADFIKNAWQSILLILSFCSFIYLNEGIVLGDKSAHIGHGGPKIYLRF